MLGLDEFINTQDRQLSLGQRMRADICCSLLHNPDILYLDEPTIGLDVVVKERIREFIRQTNRARGTTVILATHDMSDIERMSSRVMVVNDGRIMYDGDLGSLRKTYGSEETVTATVLGDHQDTSSLRSLGVSDVEYEGNRMTIRYNPERVNSSTVVGWLMEHAQTRDLSIVGSQIEDVIRRMYQAHERKRDG